MRAASRRDRGLTRALSGTLLGLAIVLAAPASVAAQDHAPPAAGQSLSVDSTMGELLDNPASRAVLEREVPVIAKSPQISAARDISLRMVAQYAPAILTAEKMALIDAALAADPAAVATEKARAPARPRDAREALSLQTIPLWPGKAPGSLGDRPMDMPTLTIVKPDEAPSFGSAVVVAPGGGYVGLATGMEGRQVADWFAANGVTAFILSYRLLSSGYGHPTQLTDAERALRWVRSHASEYGIDPNRIGMIGFSAGGHLTAMASTQFDAGNPSSDDPVEQASSRPDFAVLGYAAIDLPSNRWQSNGFIPKHAAPETRAQVAPARNVRADTPPTFLVHTTTDELVPATNATLYYDALVKAGVPAELHIFANGRHGLGLGQSEDALSAWPMLLRNWLKDRGIIGSATN